MAMIAMTTKSSIRVKPNRFFRCKDTMDNSQKKKCEKNNAFYFVTKSSRESKKKTRKFELITTSCDVDFLSESTEKIREKPFLFCVRLLPLYRFPASG